MSTRIINTYLWRQVALATVLATLMVTAVVWLTQALRLIELVLDRGAPVVMLLWMLLLTIPTFLGLILPIGFAAAVLFAFYKLMQDQELAVLRASGFSHWQLARPALKLALLLAVVAYGVSFVVAPAANRELARQEFLVKNDYALVLLRDGMFNALGDGMTVFVRERRGLNELRGIMLHDASQEDKETTLLAEEGVIKETAEGTRVVMVNGRRQEKNLQTGEISELRFGQYTLDLNQFGSGAGMRAQNPREQSARELWRGSLKTTEQARVQQVELLNRALAPLFVFGFPLLALVLLLTAELNRFGVMRRVAVAVIGIILWQVAYISLLNLIPKQLALLPALLALCLLPLPLLAGRLWWRK